MKSILRKIIDPGTDKMGRKTMVRDNHLLIQEGTSEMGRRTGLDRKTEGD